MPGVNVRLNDLLGQAYPTKVTFSSTSTPIKSGDVLIVGKSTYTSTNVSGESLNLNISPGVYNIRIDQHLFSSVTIPSGDNTHELSTLINSGDLNSIFVEGSDSVTSVFGRAGAVTAASGDYDWNQINKDNSNISDISGRSHTDLQDIGTNTHAQIDSHISDTSIHFEIDDDLTGDSNTWSAEKINLEISTSSGSGGGDSSVTSVFGRSGDVVAESGDYTWDQINKDDSNIADLSGRSHTDLQDIGSNTHTQIDSHIGDGSIHFTISDGTTSTTSTWSSDKISSEIAAGGGGGGGGSLTTANEDFSIFVSPDGDDGNDGLSAGSPLASIQLALNKLATEYILGTDVQATVELATGTYNTTGSIVLTNGLGAGRFVISGDSTTPSNVIVSSDIDEFSRGAFEADERTNGLWIIEGIRIQSSGSNIGAGVKATSGGVVRIRFLEFGANLDVSNIWADYNGTVDIIGDYTIVNNTPIHYFAREQGLLRLSRQTVTVTLGGSGTRNFSTAFALCDSASLMRFDPGLVTFSGSGTGRRYIVRRNATIYVGGSSTFFPGDVAGLEQTEGLYA